MWACGIEGCGRTFDGVEPLLVHQVEDHDRHECAVCGAVVPEGFFAIEHAFENHTRAEYVRAYDADSDDIRARESVKDTVEAAVDVAALKRQLGAES